VSDDAQARAMVRQAVDAFGGLNILVNNAAMTHFVNFADLEGLQPDMWDDVWNVNVKGAFFCARAAAPEMKRTGRGAIVNVGSVAGVRAIGSSIAYAASKAALLNMTVALARVLGPEIRVNAVSPGFIDTRWLRNGLGEEMFERARAFEAARAPLKGVCTPETVAQVILGLIESSDLVTGQNLVIDGGVGII
jgi:3-oxoacyl-[acyl-carrier protein] reductase